MGSGKSILFRIPNNHEPHNNYSYYIKILHVVYLVYIIDSASLNGIYNVKPFAIVSPESLILIYWFYMST